MPNALRVMINASNAMHNVIVCKIAWAMGYKPRATGRHQNMSKKEQMATC